MSVLPNPEAHPDLNLTVADQPAEVIDLQEYLERRAIESLGDAALATAQHETTQQDTEREIARYREARKIEEAKTSQAAFAALAKEYAGLINNLARNFFITGALQDDVRQEATFGFYKAVKDYDSNKGSFESFAGLCIRRQIITAYKTASRQKHAPLNTALSFNHTPAGYDDGSDFTFGDIIASESPRLEDVVIGNEILKDMVEVISCQLSPFEEGVVKTLLEGRTYEEAAEELGKGIKAVDNGAQRAKAKLRKRLAEHDPDRWLPRVPPENNPTGIDLEFIEGLHVLSGQESLILRLRVQGMSNKAISEEVGITPESIRQLLMRAKRKLAGYLIEHGGQLDWEELINSSQPKFMDANAEPIQGLDVPPAMFTLREYGTLKLRAEGKSNMAIGEVMGVRPKDVENAIQCAKRKIFNYLETQGDREQTFDWATFINIGQTEDVSASFEPINGLDVPPAQFTPMQYQLLKLRAEGKSNMVIGKELGMNLKAVERTLGRAKRNIFEYFELNGGGHSFDWLAFINSPTPKRADPESESIEGLDISPSEFSYLEYWALKMRTKGKSNRVIAEELGAEPASVRDAFLRAKRKAEDLGTVF